MGALQLWSHANPTATKKEVGLRRSTWGVDRAPLSLPRHYFASLALALPLFGSPLPVCLPAVRFRPPLPLIFPSKQLPHTADTETEKTQPLARPSMIHQGTTTQTRHVFKAEQRRRNAIDTINTPTNTPSYDNTSYKPVAGSRTTHIAANPLSGHGAHRSRPPRHRTPPRVPFRSHHQTATLHGRHQRQIYGQQAVVQVLDLTPSINPRSSLPPGVYSCLPALHPAHYTKSKKRENQCFRQSKITKRCLGLHVNHSSRRIVETQPYFP